MRPPHEAGEVGHNNLEISGSTLPSMRPPHEAGEVGGTDGKSGDAAGPSMRPPHEAGEVEFTHCFLLNEQSLQ